MGLAFNQQVEPFDFMRENGQLLLIVLAADAEVRQCLLFLGGCLNFVFQLDYPKA